jgi:DNA-binding Lrp family transcriptional regulator
MVARGWCGAPAIGSMVQNPAIVCAQSAETLTFDALDHRIILALTVDGRAPFRRIAEVLGASEQTVARRYRRMREAGVLRVVVLRNRFRDNQFVRIRVAPGAAEPIATALARRADVSWVAIDDAGADVSCAWRSDDSRAREELLFKGLPRLSQVTGVSAATLLHAFAGGAEEEWHGFEEQLTDAEAAALLRDRERGPLGEELTPEDLALLAPLAVDGRTSYAALAAATGRREGAVARRVEQLLARSAVFTDVELALGLLGFHCRAMLWLTVAPADLHAVGSAIATHPESSFVGAVSGVANLAVSIVARDTTDLYRYITERLGPLPAIRQLEVSVASRLLKQAGTVMDGDRLPAPV